MVVLHLNVLPHLTQRAFQQGWYYYLTIHYNAEGDGTPLQYSCLENPMDGGAWWAAVYGVAQSQTRLKRLSSIHYKIYSGMKGFRTACLAFYLTIHFYQAHWLLSEVKSGQIITE